jgi:hypothetical protein
MFDHFLTTVLQIIIIVDVLGLIAYFVLGALRSKTQEQAVPQAQRFSIWDRLPWRRSRAAIPATNSEFGQLKKVLFGFQEGLASA